MYSALEVANICGVVNQTAINWIRNGYLKAFNTPGGQYRVYYEDLLLFIKERGMKVPPELQDSLDDAHWNSIIVIDDDIVLNEAIASFFVKNLPNLIVYKSFDGFDAGTKLVKHKPGFVILDIDLPGVNGKEICKKIKTDPFFGQPYIIVITGLDDESLEKQMKDLGADAFFRKPIDFNALLSEINEVVS
ncbi:response regulator [Treponema sp. OMZ 788]|uniref:response regulator n=1 Tax=unclassified Treponema TaxID=2638727 RepID=UPI0020A367CE|nr:MULTISPECIES: response regulator [unclassified Treponema]UTC63616.1 response regulator [Treponema sp. OMZ 787]UTC64866.1 response regulator [Treponema sp. OMZ 788]